MAKLNLSEGKDAFRFWREAIEASINAIAITDVQGTLSYANPAFLRMWGFDDPDEALGRQASDFAASPEQYAEVIGILATMGGWVGEAVGVRKNGERFDVMISSTLLKDEAGAPVGMMASIVDISAHRQAEQALREREAQYRSLVENAQDPIFSSDINGRYLYVNTAAAARLGTTPEHVVGKTVDELFPPDVAELYRAGVRRVIESGESTNNQDRVVIEGQVSWYNSIVQPVRDSKGRIVAAQAVVRDITSLKRAEEALRESEELLRQAVLVASLGIFYHDHINDEIYWSPRQREIWGWGPDEPLKVGYFFGVAGRPPEYLTLIHPDDRDRIVKARARAHAADNPDGLFDVEYRIIRRDGTLRWIAVRAQTFFEGEGDARRPVRTIGAVRDITEQKTADEERTRLETQLAQSHRMELVGRLAGGVAHDFNNMLGVILGRLELAMSHLGEHDPIQTDLSEAQFAARRSADLTRQLLGFARRQTIQPRTINLNEYIENSLPLLRRLVGESVEFVWQPDRELDAVQLDPSQLDQILTNLAANARDAISDVGRVTVRTRHVAFDRAYCAAHPGAREGRYVMVEVEDTGVGIDPETLAHIYEPFFTTKEYGKGTGLGLATVYGIVKQNNGFISISSAPGKGTTVQICLPRVADNAGREDAAPPAPRQTGVETVLLVEDEPTVMRLNATILERLGYQVFTASTPREALRCFDTHSREIQLLVSDVVMPEMNGHELVRQLRSLSPDLKCLLLSGYVSEQILSEPGGAGGIHFLQKPFSVPDFAAKVRGALDSPAGPQPARD